jgi:hypothetical protein
MRRRSDDSGLPDRRRSPRHAQRVGKVLERPIATIRSGNHAGHKCRMFAGILPRQRRYAVEPRRRPRELVRQLQQLVLGAKTRDEPHAERQPVRMERLPKVVGTPA